MSEITSIIFDMDDTLLQCAKYYNERKQLFAENASKRLNIPAFLCAEILTNLDLSCTALDHGFSKHRFPRSFAAASAALDLICGRKIDDVAVEQAYLLGQSVFDAPYEPYVGVLDTLKAYTNSGYQLVLWSKGDYKIQMKKVLNNGLLEFFDRDNIYIVPKKEPDSLFQIMEDNELSPKEAILVGDSLRDDIRCGNEAKISTVWVRGSFNKNWAYENQPHQPTYTIETIMELPNIVPVKVLN